MSRRTAHWLIAIITIFVGVHTMPGLVSSARADALDDVASEMNAAELELFAEVLHAYSYCLFHEYRTVCEVGDPHGVSIYMDALPFCSDAVDGLQQIQETLCATDEAACTWIEVHCHSLVYSSCVQRMSGLVVAPCNHPPSMCQGFCPYENGEPTIYGDCWECE